MAKAKSKATPAMEWRILRWILLLFVWRLPRAIIRAVIWIFGLLTRLWSRHDEAAETADSFYRSYKWRRLRVDALEANRERYGMLACECCGMMEGCSFHVDHIYPRSTHPELALDPANLQVLCDACNVGKGTAYTTNWRGGDGPELPKRRGFRRWFA